MGIKICFEIFYSIKNHIGMVATSYFQKTMTEELFELSTGRKLVTVRTMQFELMYDFLLISFME